MGVRDMLGPRYRFVNPTFGYEGSGETRTLFPIPKQVGHLFKSGSHSQSQLDLVDGGDSIGTVSIGDGGVLLGGIVTE